MSAICRFHELTKTEIIVLSFLYASRNRRTGQCNPRRIAIAEATGVHKSHVSQAVKTLISKQWIDESSDGEFSLQETSLEVAESATESSGIGNLQVAESATFENEKVAESATTVAESATESSGIGNSKTKTRNITRARVLNTELTQKEHSKNMSRGDHALAVFENWKKVLNHTTAKFDPKRQNKINARLKDGFTADQLMLVPHGVLRSPHHMGKNDANTRYDGIETIYRDAAQVEKFMALAEAPATNVHRNGFDPGRVIEPVETDEVTALLGELRPQRDAPSVPIEEQHVWNAFTDALKKKLTSDIYAAWFAPLIFEGVDAANSRLKVRARPVDHDWIKQYYSELIYETLITCGLAEFTLDWEVEEEVYEENV